MVARNRSTVQWALTFVVVAGLAVDAWVHIDLASAFASVKTSTMSQADLFRVEAVLAVVAALALLIRPRRYPAGLAFLVAAGGTFAVVLYRYVDVGQIGPVPNMYDPYWAPTGKTVSLVAEVLAALAALGLVALFRSDLIRDTTGESAGQPRTAASQR